MPCPGAANAGIAIATIIAPTTNDTAINNMMRFISNTLSVWAGATFSQGLL
jgi:hypothetical protein